MKQSRKHVPFHIRGLVWASFLLAGGLLANEKAGIFDKNSDSTSPVYTYEFTESREGDVESWRAVFKDVQKKDYAVENTILKGGKLVRYALAQPQLGEDADVRVSEVGVTFRYLSNGKWKEDFESTKEGVIAGPQIVDHIQRNWDALKSGKTLYVRCVIPDRLETVGFRFTSEPSKDPKISVFHFAPSNFFIRALVGRVVLEFETATKNPTLISGRTFLKQKRGDDWEALTADIRFDRP